MPKFATDGKYMKWQELPEGQDLVLTIRSHKQTEFEGKNGQEEKKWVLFFEEVDKGLALNATNGKTLCKLYGDEMDDWIGHKIALYTKDDVEYAGELVSAIRVRPKKVV